jgi:hypothetical protein
MNRDVYARRVGSHRVPSAPPSAARVTDWYSDSGPGTGVEGPCRAGGRIRTDGQLFTNSV